ncbi:MAG TPA: MotA/TolQ/ExbB proton channel family protein [Candidatus Binataceae bacterium]|nr:MotA/TolQ/ExbB proton channel family protein [Candidatus Binataceae bacterium]
MQTQFGILDMIRQGYYATYPLLFISIVCLAIIFERLWALRGHMGKAAKNADAIVPQLRQGNFSAALQTLQARSNPSERVYHSLVTASQTMNREELMDFDDERRYQETLELRRYIWVLATAGASAPFIGLFGTVVGILVAFQSMAIMGTGGFSVVAAGISEALISTALGLAVAIIAVIFYNYFSVKVENINAILRVNSERLIDSALQAREAHGH